MTTEKKLWRNRKTRKELARRLQSENPGLEAVHPHPSTIAETIASVLEAGFCQTTIYRG